MAPRSRGSRRRGHPPLEPDLLGPSSHPLHTIVSGRSRELRSHRAPWRGCERNPSRGDRGGRGRSGRRGARERSSGTTSSARPPARAFGPAPATAPDGRRTSWASASRRASGRGWWPGAASGWRARGYEWHEASDGAATFPVDDGGWILVSNSETLDGGASAVRFRRDGAACRRLPDPAAAQVTTARAAARPGARGSPARRWRTGSCGSAIPRAGVIPCGTRPWGCSSTRPRPWTRAGGGST